MATAYKIAQHSITSNTGQVAFTATASNTVVSSIICTDSTGATITLAVQKGSTIMQIVNQTLASNASVDLLASPIALEATDKLVVTSTKTSNTSNLVISYVEDTNSVSGQSIGVLADVPTSLGTNGQVLAVNGTGTSLAYVDQSSGGALDDLSDVTPGTVNTGDVLVANAAGTFTSVNTLQEIKTLLKSGTGSTTLTGDGSGTSTDDGRLDLTDTKAELKFGTDSNVELTSTTARLKSGVTELKVTETSPGELDFVVAAGASGSETAFTAVEINGTTTANVAEMNIKNGTAFYIHGASGGARLQYAGSGAAITLPATAGTLAKTTDIALDSAVVSNTAKTGITSGQASAITANTAKISYTDASAVAANTAKIATVFDDTSPQLGGNLDVKAQEINTSTADGNIVVVPNGTGFLEVKGNQASSADNPGAIRFNCAANTHGVTIQSPPHSDGAIYTLTLPPGLEAGDANKVLKTDANGALDWVSQTVNTNTQNTTTLSFADSSNDVILRNTTGGAGSGTQDVKFVAGANITLTHTDANNITIASSGGGGGGGGSLTAVTGTAPIVSSGGNTPAISISAATTSAAGSMSAADKTKINNITAVYDNTGTNSQKDIVFESSGGISDSAGKIVSMLQDSLADNTNANSKDFLGVVTSTADQCVINGVVEISQSVPTGATEGRPLWLGVSGAFIASAPTATNSYARVLGHYLGSVSGGFLMYFNPSNDWIQID